MLKRAFLYLNKDKLPNIQCGVILKCLTETELNFLFYQVNTKQNNNDTDMIEELDSPMSAQTLRGKLDSTSRESRASDSGISAEYSCDSNTIITSANQNDSCITNTAPTEVANNNHHIHCDNLRTHDASNSSSDTSNDDVLTNFSHGKSGKSLPPLYQYVVERGGKSDSQPFSSHFFRFIR